MDPKTGRAVDLNNRLVEHGESCIDEMIASGVSEELYLDYKLSATKADSKSLHQDDRDNYARAVAGFANSDGGVILWGVDCRNDPQLGDVPTKKVPVQKAKRFVSWLESLTSGCTVPSHASVRHFVIEVDGTEDGFVVSLVSKSMFAPLQCALGKHKDKYLIRVGSSFAPTPHSVLAGMFGRRPSPYVFLIWQGGGELTSKAKDQLIRSLSPEPMPYILIEPTLRNEGVVLARDLYVNVYATLPGPNCLIVPYETERAWHLTSVLGAYHSVSHEQVRLAPMAMLKAHGFSILLKPPFTRDFRFEVSFGCDSSPVGSLIQQTTVEEVKGSWEHFMQSPMEDADGMRLFREILKPKGDREEID